MKKYALIFGLLVLPVVAQAQSTIINIVDKVKELLDVIIPLLITLAIVYFFWGLAKFILAAGDASKQAEGKSVMVWGVIALFVLVSVWGLVAVLQSTFGTTESAETTQLPSINFFASSSSSNNGGGGNQNPPTGGPGIPGAPGTP